MPIPTKLETGQSGPTLVAREGETSLTESVTQALKRYFKELKSEEPVELYKFVIEEVEAPLLKMVMERYRYNQSRAASVLGLSRGTLRCKLRHHFDDKYVGTRGDNKRYSGEGPEGMIHSEEGGRETSS